MLTLGSHSKRSGKLTSFSQPVQGTKKSEASDEEGSFSRSVSLVDRHDESSSGSSSSKGKRPEKAPKKIKPPAYNVAPYSKGGRLFGSFACRVDVDERSPEASVIKSDAKIALQDRTRRKFEVRTDRSYSGKLKIEFIPESPFSSRGRTRQK